MPELNRSDSRDALLKLFKRIDLETMNPGHDAVSLQEICGGIVREAGELMARMGSVDLFEESFLVIAPEIELPELGVHAPLTFPDEAKGFINKCLQRLPEVQTDGPNHDARRRRLRNNVPDRLAPCHKTAYDQYQEAAQAHGGYLTDDHAYQYAGRRHRDLPQFDTWVRYVRQGRRYYNNKKNNPRYGRPHGPSIVKASQL